MKILGMMHGQIGDQFIALPLIDHIKRIYNCSHYVCNINKKYSCAIGALTLSPLINDFFISDEYENFPSKKDQVNLDKYGFDKIFDPMPRHKNPSGWHTERHQTSEVFDMYGFPYGNIDGYQIKLDIHKMGRLHDLKNTVTIAPFAGFYNPENDKKLTINKAIEITKVIKSFGLEVIQIGGADEPHIDGCHQASCSYLNSLKLIVSSKFFIHTDTGIGWAASGFKHPCLGLYSDAYYSKQYIKNIQPINPNAIYLSENNVNEIELDDIKDGIKNLL